MKILATYLLLFAIPAFAAGEPSIEMTRTFTHPQLQLTVLGGEVDLPAEGPWGILQPEPGSPLSNVYLIPPPQQVGRSGTTMETIERERKIDAGERVPSPSIYRYRITALRCGEIKEPVRITLRNTTTDQEVPLLWDGRNATAGDEELVKSWVQAQSRSWISMLLQPDSTVLRLWAARQGELYGKRDIFWPTIEAQNERGDRTTNLFQVLGGRAAIRETLQMQAIDPRGTTTEEKETVSIDTLPGVQVKSHPFAEMLQGKQGGNLPLADSVPPDRFFIYFGKPSALVGFLEGGSDFLARSGSLFTQTSVDDGLESKYLARLGLDGKWAREFLRNGFVTEIGVVLPDLFLLDGTEITVMMRVPQMTLAQPMLRFLGLSGLEEGKQPISLPVRIGGSAYWAVRGDLLLVSTHPQELDRVLQFHHAGGKGGLGQSEEFRYMLTRLPIEKNTWGYAYLSDPFIRHLVSPATKIAQLRRLRAHADLQTITAGALLYKANCQPGIPTLAKLVELGYVPASLMKPDYALRQDLVAESKKYGTLARPATLLTNPVTQASDSEAAAYKRYLDGYDRFWRQFFDPIAVRLNETDSGSFELSTFILPLVESQLYNQVRASVATAETGAPLEVLNLDPQPVLTFSLNLKREGWMAVAKRLRLSELFSHSGLDPEILDYLGPSLHLAIADSDPIIALGTGDMLGAFGANSVLMRSNEMFFIPVVLSILTRPSTLVVELTNPQKVLQLLKRSGNRRAFPLRQSEANFDLQRIAGRDAWVYSIDIINMIRLSFGLEVQGNHLLITNLPWTQKPRVASVAPAPMNGALLQANPSLARQQLPALYASAVAQERAAAMQGIGYLYPLLMSVSKTPAEATVAHAQLFGFKPVHPASGEWLWEDGRLASSIFGTPLSEKQPEYQPGQQDFGLLPGNIDRFSVNMQFEEAGLRTSIRWSLHMK